MRGVRKEKSGHSSWGVILLIVLFGGYMVYTGIYDPLEAANRLFNTLLRMLPSEMSNLIRQVIDLLLQLISPVLDIFRQLINEIL